MRRGTHRSMIRRDTSSEVTGCRHVGAGFRRAASGRFGAPESAPLGRRRHAVGGSRASWLYRPSRTALAGAAPRSNRSSEAGRRQAGRAEIQAQTRPKRHRGPRSDFLGHDEPRDPHADEWRAGLRQSAARDAAQCRAAGNSPQSVAALGRCIAHYHQRRARLLEDRSGAG